MNILTNLNLNKNEIQNFRIQNLATAPQHPAVGQQYYDTVDKVVKTWNGTTWVTGDAPIESIKVNGTAQPITNKEVDLTVAEITTANTASEKSVEISDGDNDSLKATQTANGVQVASGSIFTEELVNKDYVDDTFLPLAGGTMTGDIAMGNKKISGLPTPTTDSEAATKGYVDTVAVGALKPSGSVAFANLPALAATNLNKLYNVTDAFTTTADFIEGAGKYYPAGTNVAIINTGTDQAPVYKYDAMTGVVDLSSYPTKTEVNGIFTVATATIATTETTKTVAFTGKLLEFYATMGGEKVLLDTEISTTNVKFTCAQAPSAAVTCTVVSVQALS